MSKGQITMDTGFGKLLAWLANNADTIVEFGTHDGTGSTRCLRLGMVRRGEQHLYSVDIDEPLQAKAERECGPDKWVFGKQVLHFIHGTIVKPTEFQEFTHPDPDSRQYYIPERDANAKAPYVLDQIPEKIDLLLLDGGEWTSNAEFLKLWERCKVIALDDCNRTKSNKNWKAYYGLLDNWMLVGEDMNERNGWAVFRRPE
jgi:hypothetical protein